MFVKKGMSFVLVLLWVVELSAAQKPALRVCKKDARFLLEEARDRNTFILAARDAQLYSAKIERDRCEQEEPAECIMVMYYFYDLLNDKHVELPKNSAPEFECDAESENAFSWDPWSYEDGPYVNEDNSEQFDDASFKMTEDGYYSFGGPTVFDDYYYWEELAQCYSGESDNESYYYKGSGSERSSSDGESYSDSLEIESVVESNDESDCYRENESYFPWSDGELSDEESRVSSNEDVSEHCDVVSFTTEEEYDRFRLMGSCFDNVEFWCESSSESDVSDGEEFCFSAKRSYNTITRQAPVLFDSVFIRGQQLKPQNKNHKSFKYNRQRERDRKNKD